jgi:hypothetical protein
MPLLSPLLPSGNCYGLVCERGSMEARESELLAYTWKEDGTMMLGGMGIRPVLPLNAAKRGRLVATGGVGRQAALLGPKGCLCGNRGAARWGEGNSTCSEDCGSQLSPLAP